MIPTMSYAYQLYYPVFKVDCQWDDWKEGQCSKSCGGGTQIDTRLKKIKAAYGGEECAGPSNITKECNTQNCPGW